MIMSWEIEFNAHSLYKCFMAMFLVCAGLMARLCECLMVVTPMI